MEQGGWHTTTTGRYASISRPIRFEHHLRQSVIQENQYVVTVHGQMILFMLFAVIVGFGLFLIVPNLSAAPDGLAGNPTNDNLAASNGAVKDSSTPELKGANGGGQISGTGDSVSDPMGSISPVFTREVRYWESRILEWSRLYNLDPDIVATIMQIESCGDPGAASYAGAQGLFQVMPFHFDSDEDMLDPDTNAMRGMAFFNRQLEYTGRDIYLSFAGYNGGYAASGSSYPYWANETQRYYTWAKGIYDDAKAGLAESPTLQQWLLAGGGSGCQRAAQRLGL